MAEAINVRALDRTEVRICHVRGCDFESGRLPDTALYAGSGRWLEFFVCPEHQDLLPDIVLPSPVGRTARWFACICGPDNKALVESERHQTYRHYRQAYPTASLLDPSIDDLLYALGDFQVKSVQIHSDQWAMVSSTGYSGDKVFISCDSIEDGLILTFEGWIFLSLMRLMRMEW